MSESVPLNMRVSPSVAATVTTLATELELSKVAVVRRALGILQAVERARQDGHYVGTARDREALDTVIVTPI
jgi:hypothetical protein